MWNTLNSQFIEAYRKKDYNTALIYAGKALDYAYDEFGEMDAHTATSINNLAVVFRTLDRLEESEFLVRRALKINVEIRGMEHPETGNCLNNLAIIHSDKGHFEEAEKLYKWALEIREKSLGSRHPDILVNVRNMSLMYAAAGRKKESAAFREKSENLEKLMACNTVV